MIYYNVNDILVRDMVKTDPEIITFEEHQQGWTHQKVEKYTQRLKDVADGKCISLVAEYEGNVARYFNVYLNSTSGKFANKNIPELIDLGVLKKYRRHGIGNILMQVAEDIAKKYSNIVCIGVGLHRDYGAAQRLYVKRSFLPDGIGLWYNGKNLKPYADMKNDNEAVIYLSKKL